MHRVMLMSYLYSTPQPQQDGIKRRYKQLKMKNANANNQTNNPPPYTDICVCTGTGFTYPCAETGEEHIFMNARYANEHVIGLKWAL